MPSITERLEEIIDEANDLIKTLEKVDAEHLGLDIRSSWRRLLTDPDQEFIGVWITEDRTLQYYGGFEYVNSSLRKTYGDYVLYYVDTERDGCRVSACYDVLNRG